MQGVIGKAVAIDARDSHYQVVCGAGLLVVLDGASPLGTSPIISDLLQPQDQQH